MGKNGKMDSITQKINQLKLALVNISSSVEPCEDKIGGLHKRLRKLIQENSYLKTKKT